MLSLLSNIDAQPVSMQAPSPGEYLNVRYIEAVSSVMTDVSANVPEIVGMTVFGSLSRREAMVKVNGSVSDIDGVVVIDADISGEFTEFLNLPLWNIVYPALGNTAVGMDIKVKMQDLIDQAANTGAQSDIDLLLVSQKQLIDTPRALLETVREPDAEVSNWTVVDDNTKDTMHYFFGREHTAGLFFPVIAGDLSQYRRMALQPLAEFRQEKPLITGRIWHNIRVLTNHFRKGRDSNEDIAEDLPVSLDEILREYGLT